MSKKILIRELYKDYQARKQSEIRKEILFIQERDKVYPSVIKLEWEGEK